MPIQSPEHSTSSLSNFKPEEAEQRVRQEIAQIPPLKGANVARLPDLDIAGYFAFSVIPSTGLAGEVLYLAGPTELLTSGQPTDFDKLMNRLEVGQKAGALDVYTFAHLFIRLRALRRGIVLDQLDGHPLLRPDQIPPDKFSPPQAEFDASGAQYHFWMFDTDRLEPVYWHVRVAADGTTSFTGE